jgi:hypothetical protein
MKLRDLSSVNLHLVESQKPAVLYHLTDNAKFVLNPDYAPEDNAISISSREGNRGIYLASDVESWVNGHGYIRPFVVEFAVDPRVYEVDRVGRWGGETFVDAEHFNLIKITRVIPIDAWAREHYGSHGWIEQARRIAYDTDEPITTKGWETPFQGWKYPGDLRQAPAGEIRKLQRQFQAGLKIRQAESR